MEKGFSLFEVMIAILVLTIGLMSAALLMANIYKFSVRSRYMALATQLASEELEDLSRWPNNANSTPPYIDPHIFVPAGSSTCDIEGETCIGNMYADYGPVTINCPSCNSTSVSYFDTVSLATENGTMSETYQMPCTGPPDGAGNYVTVSYSPNGVAPPTPAPCFANPPTGVTFDRRWVIEQDQPLPGMRRITVKVTLMDLTIQPPLTFQMSMVRP